ncbi:sulfatase family protein [Carboxylicivirga sp. RSCT41]|uniref:sulfatase family protein n=1 Tax=Carboxylicivirga agarovorans TaxID=3417570 RepID=UPI003D325D00
MKTVFSVLLVVQAVFFTACTTKKHTKEKPNIIFIFTDDHASQAISAYGGILADVAPTPNLDKLANEGMLFKRCMVTNSICGPSRAAILTGKHSHANGFYQNENTVFDGQQFTFPKALQASGYQTGVVGKWHLGGKPTGFDYWEILPGQGAYYNPDFITTDGTYREVGYVTDIVTDKAKKWLEGRDKNKPFMLMVQHKAPHRNWMPAERHLSAFDDVSIPEPTTLFDDYDGRGTAARDQDMSIEYTMDMGKDLKVNSLELDNRLSTLLNRMNENQRAAWDKSYEPKNNSFVEAELSGNDLVRWKYQRYIKDYLRCIKAVDESVGELKAYLEANGLDKNTIIVYSSDQGFYLGEHGWFDKRFMYDESYRTPLIVKWPGVIKGASINSDLVSNLDFASTFLEMAGTTIPDEVQGESLVPLLKGHTPDSWRKSLYYHYYEYPGWHMVHRHEGAYDGRYKLMNFYDLNEWELYDLETDPNEMKNQINNPEYANVVKVMRAELNKLRTQYKVPENQPQYVSNPDMRYHSETMRKRALTH